MPPTQLAWFSHRLSHRPPQDSNSKTELLLHPFSQSPIPSCTRVCVFQVARWMLKQAIMQPSPRTARVHVEPTWGHTQAPSPPTHAPPYPGHLAWNFLEGLGRGIDRETEVVQKSVLTAPGSCWISILRGRSTPAEWSKSLGEARTMKDTASEQELKPTAKESLPLGRRMSQGQRKQHREGTHCTDGESKVHGGEQACPRPPGGVWGPPHGENLHNKSPSPLRFWAPVMVPSHVPASGADTEQR